MSRIAFTDKFSLVLDIFVGVYEIHFKDKVYVGVSKNVFSRISIHRSNLRKGKYSFDKMQQAYNSVDESEIFIIIYRIASRKKAGELEEKLTRKYLMLGTAINNQIGNKCRVVSQETRDKISKAGLGRVPSEESNQKRSKTLTGHKVSVKTRRKISDSLKRRNEEN